MRTEDRTIRGDRALKSLRKALFGDPDFLTASKVLVRGKEAAGLTVRLATAEPSKSFLHSNWLVTENPGIREMLESNHLKERVEVASEPFVRSRDYDLGVLVHDAFMADSTALFETSRLIQNGKAKKAFVLTHKRTGARRLVQRMARELGQAELVARGSGGIRVLKVGIPEATRRVDPYKSVELSIPGRSALSFVTIPSLFSSAKVDPGSRMLIEYVLETIGDEPRETCLMDLGCGYGVVGLALASWLRNTKVFMTDADARAVYVSRKNVSRLGLRNQALVALADGGRGVREKFELIVSNPPLHVSFGSLKTMLGDAFQLLTREGAMLLVVETSRVDGLSAAINSTAGSASEVVRAEGHSIIRAILEP